MFTKIVQKLSKVKMRPPLSLSLGLLIILSLIVSGCAVTKTKYESSVKAVLKRVEEESKPIQKELKKVSSERSKSANQQLVDLNRRQIDLLEQTKAELEDITPPDDFFVGHSDLVEFVELLIEANKLAVSPSDNKKSSQQSSPEDRTETLEVLSASTNAYSKALRELSFLEYELKRAFSDILNQVQNQAFEQLTR